MNAACVQEPRNEPRKVDSNGNSRKVLFVRMLRRERTAGRFAHEGSFHMRGPTLHGKEARITGCSLAW